MMTFTTAYVLLCSAVMVHLIKHWFILYHAHREEADRKSMDRWLDWDNTNRSTRKRREDARLTKWQKFGITN